MMEAVARLQKCSDRSLPKDLVAVARREREALAADLDALFAEARKTGMPKEAFRKRLEVLNKRYAGTPTSKKVSALTLKGCQDEARAVLRAIALMADAACKAPSGDKKTCATAKRARDLASKKKPISAKEYASLAK